MVPAAQMGEIPEELDKLPVNAIFFNQKKKFKSVLVFSEAVQSILCKLFVGGGGFNITLMPNTFRCQNEIGMEIRKRNKSDKINKSGNIIIVYSLPFLPG